MSGIIAIIFNFIGWVKNKKIFLLIAGIAYCITVIFTLKFFISNYDILWNLPIFLLISVIIFNFIGWVKNKGWIKNKKKFLLIAYCITVIFTLSYNGIQFILDFLFINLPIFSLIPAIICILEFIKNEDILTGKTDDGITWIYTGSILNVLRHGKGKCTWSDGRIYEGEWVNDKRTGKGKTTFANGDVYEGDYVDSKKQGKGKFTFNGGIYEGDWVDDKYSKGKMTFSDGNVYEGNFVDGKPSGKGKTTFSNGNVYEGNFVDGEPSGKGKTTFANGDVYEGNFVDGEPSGKGKMTFANGDVYEGDFVDGAPSGKGKKIFADGTIYEGDFVSGVTKEVWEKTKKGKIKPIDTGWYAGKGGRIADENNKWTSWIIIMGDDRIADMKKSDPYCDGITRGITDDMGNERIFKHGSDTGFFFNNSFFIMQDEDKGSIEDLFR